MKYQKFSHNEIWKYKIYLIFNNSGAALQTYITFSWKLYRIIKNDSGDSLENPWLFQSTNAYSTLPFFWYLPFTSITIKPENVGVNKVIIVIITIIITIIIVIIIIILIIIIIIIIIITKRLWQESLHTNFFFVLRSINHTRVRKVNKGGTDVNWTSLEIRYKESHDITNM